MVDATDRAGQSISGRQSNLFKPLRRHLRATDLPHLRATRNPGGPNPGIGPWQPFTSLALPRMPPPLGLMPSHGFYLGARRDQPGQAFDGDVYFGEILSIGGVKSDDD